MSAPGIFSSCSIPKGVRVRFESPVYLTETSITSNVQIGAYTYFGAGCRIGTLAKIGRFCSIAPSVTIGLGNHPTEYLSTHPLFFRSAGMFQAWPKPDIGIDRPPEVTKTSPIIGNDVWIGANSVIGRGVTIGDGAIIGAGSVVLKDVAPYAIVAGAPARLIRYRCSEERVEELKKLQWWRYPLEVMKDIPVNNLEQCIPILREKLASLKPEQYTWHDYVDDQFVSVAL